MPPSVFVLTCPNPKCGTGVFDELGVRFCPACSTYLFPAAPVGEREDARSRPAGVFRPVTEKRCSSCLRVKPAAGFAHNRANADGLHRWCRRCSNFAANARRAAA